jgi:calnexin
MQSDILFDNIYIGHSLEDANAFKAETYGVKRPIEVAQEEAARPKTEPAAGEKPAINFKEDPVKYVRARVDYFLTLAKVNPIEAAKAAPDVAGGLGALLLTLVLVIVGAIGMSTPAPAPVKKEAGKAKEATAEADKAVSTGAEKTKGEATKRTTRSG